MPREDIKIAPDRLDIDRHVGNCLDHLPTPAPHVGGRGACDGDDCSQGIGNLGNRAEGVTSTPQILTMYRSQ